MTSTSSSTHTSLIFETKWHSTATTSYILHQRPSYPLSDISTNCTTMKISSSTKILSSNKFQTSDGSSTESDECETGDLSSDEYPTQLKENYDNEMSDIALFLNDRRQIAVGAAPSENSVRRFPHRPSSLSHIQKYSSPSKSKLSLTDHAKSLIKNKVILQKQRSIQRIQLYEDLKKLNHRRIQVIDELINLDELHEQKVKQLSEIL
ncbi:unnamed protein product [Didymodactylos carnosus]|uniref:Uncharacterized protein n=1 Tax=Didymodactylos carnosus TaxID=1234261 RepID=A0A814CHK2_9BILA|nr:unnamed protein product [Didymodactylos carnosus]CAF1100008.1 unnamed protein product [Didymodactylos carnosus]CAF3716780.1 unnamed protein product [Didymodactylos carnosus]CAF3861468.1 unnamed protein product [Didymodactylos carnosus]